MKLSEAALYSFVSAALAVIVAFPAATEADAPDEGLSRRQREDADVRERLAGRLELPGIPEQPPVRSQSQDGAERCQQERGDRRDQEAQGRNRRAEEKAR